MTAAPARSFRLRAVRVRHSITFGSKPPKKTKPQKPNTTECDGAELAKVVSFLPPLQMRRTTKTALQIRAENAARGLVWNASRLLRVSRAHCA